MADYSGTTLLTLDREALREGPGGKLLRAVQKAVASDYEVLGEMGRSAKGRIVYLARERASRHLVALQLTPGENAAERGEMWLDVLRKLDASVPSGDDKCPRCSTAIKGWARFCSQCGADLSGVAPGSGSDTSMDQLLAAVKEAAGQRYEVLGLMDRAEGGGVVYFARERATGNVVALRLQRRPEVGGRRHYDLGRTMVLKSVVESMVGRETDEPELAPGVQTAAPSPVAPASAPTPAAGPKPPGRRGLVLAGIGVLAAVLLLSLWARATREPVESGGDTTAAALDLDAAGETDVDSAEVEVGGKLPPGATLSIDGIAFPGRTVRAAPGRHEFKAKAPGYTTAAQSLELRPGQLLTWTPQLVRQPTPRPRSAEPSRRSEVSAPSPAPPLPPEVAPETLAIHQVPSQPAPVDTQPAGVLPTSEPTCGSTFATLEWSRALSICRREAEAGGTSAQRVLGTMYERGLATEATPTLAAEWYGKAAAGGDQIAQYRLGVLLRDGRGVKKDEKAAIEWFRKSAEQGERDAQTAMAYAYDEGRGVRRSRTTAAPWYLKAAEQGSAAAQFRLGEFYAKGEAGLAKSEPDAVKWFRLAAAQGHKEAQEELAERAPR